MAYETEVGNVNTIHQYRPFCAKCGSGKRVDWMDSVLMMNSDEYSFRVGCHGEIDNCVVARETFFSGGIEPGYAFRENKLDHTQGLPEPAQALPDAEAA